MAVKKARTARRITPAFTLVELLVVVAIIAVLIAILLPSLNKARQQAMTVQCQSNLRQIGQAIQMYCGENKGFLMPVVMYPNDTNTQDTLHYYDWVWYLVDGNYVSLNQGGSVGNFANTAGKDDWGHSVFHCPSGLSPDEFPYGQPNSTSKWDPTGSQFTEYEENLRPGVIAPTFLSCWYTLNSADLVGGFGAYPFNAAPHTGTGGGTSPAVDADDRTLQLSFLNPSSQIPLAFDGNNVVVNNNDSGGNYKGPFSGHGANISARHNNYTTCNVVFADGHVEGLTLGQLPGGAPHGGTVPGTIGPNGPGTGNELGNPTALDARNPAVKWMLPPNSYYKNGQP